MAALRAKPQLKIGSSQWILNEREQATSFIEQEVEEFGFSAQNEMEWLNEHMADIFSRNQLDFAEVFKTPGKLRGKTPRTARKRDPLTARAPLTDVFGPSPQVIPGSAQKTAFYKKVVQSQLVEDAENQGPPPNALSTKTQVGTGKENTDSGYHGTTEDEMEVDGAPLQPPTRHSLIKDTTPQIVHEACSPLPRRISQAVEGVRALDESFVSAQDSMGLEDEQKDDAREDDEMTVADEDMDDEEVLVERGILSDETAEKASAPGAYEGATHQQDSKPDSFDHDLEGMGSRTPSEGSSPVKPLLRKSSLTFATLPAREPLTAKKSMGPRSSHAEGYALGAFGQSSIPGKSHGGKSLGYSQQKGRNDDDEETEHLDVDHTSTKRPIEGLETTKLHSKTTTQLLQERIEMLGKTKETRLSKSIPSLATNSQPTYPQLVEIQEGQSGMVTKAPQVPPKDTAVLNAPSEDDDDDWIAPIRTSGSATQAVQTSITEHVRQMMQGPAATRATGKTQNITGAQERNTYAQGALPAKRGMGHQKSNSTMSIMSPSKAATESELGYKKAASVSNPNLTAAAGELQSTTPAGSPMGKRYPDGPLSASKAKLYSVLNRAKGIFASSAGVSAEAKMEALSTTAPRSPERNASGRSKKSSELKMPGGLYPDLEQASAITKGTERPMSVVSTSSSASNGRKTRSSSESAKKREKGAKEKQKIADELEKAREKERVAAHEQYEERLKIEQADAARMEHERQEAASRAESRASTDDMPPPPPPKSMLPAGKLRAPGRLVRPTKIEQPKAKPVPVSIRVASQSQRIGSIQAPSTSFSSSVHNSMAPPPPKQAASAKTSTASTLSAASAAGKRTAAASSARVKALEAAAKKKEQEELAVQRKADQKRERERERAAKLEDERRQEEERRATERADQQRTLEAKKAQKQAAEQKKLEQQKQAAAPPRMKPLSDLAQVNAAKPAKRVFQPEQDDQLPPRPALQRGPPSYHQQDAKRRKTMEDEESDERHSVMAPPKRPSNMRKETLTKFPHGYTHAPPPTSHHVPNMFKQTVTAQHQLAHPPPRVPTHPNDMLKVSNAKIPFAENANPPPAAGPSHAQYQAQTNGAQTSFKTPGRPQQAPKSAKSSPAYPKGDNIELPEIATDSEDEDSEDEENTGFRAPSWVASPALRELLTQQQLVDPSTIFGPIAPLSMEEVFKGGKNADRMKRFRDRGSSARWVESGDAVTEDEKKKDWEGRERVVREGGWTFMPGT
ncbi:hypothetical protein LTR66_006549 [Elasticomyces elasticus]|nr:hypothetical protein LTR66_006549 [Elasticomyces elasticus]